jgi:competence protein ComEA
MGNMKPWQNILLGVFFGLLAGALVLLISSRPRGAAITLPPLPTPAPLVVHISGAVAREGMYALPSNSRLDDVIQAAGGLLPSADVERVNLAARLSDGQKIIIPVAGATAETGEPAATGPERGNAVIEVAGQSSLININTATLEELDRLPGIGESKAADIIAYREKNGLFTAIEEIQNVPGIGPKIFETIQTLITIS